MNKKQKRNDAMQKLCRQYLYKLRNIASKYGMLAQLNNIINMNRRNECTGTEKEVEMLSRIVNDERIARHDIPKLLGLSYRTCNENGHFERIRRVVKNGTYSKVSALLHKSEM